MWNHIVLCVDYHEPVKIVSPKGKNRKNDNNKTVENNTKKKYQNHHTSMNFKNEVEKEVVDFDSHSIDTFEKSNEIGNKDENLNGNDKEKGKLKDNDSNNNNNNINYYDNNYNNNNNNYNNNNNNNNNTIYK